MQFRTQVTLIVACALVVWVAYLLIVGEPITLRMLAPFGAATGLTTLAAVVFSNYVWKWGWLRKWLIDRPYIGGTWKSRLISNYKENGINVEKEVYVVIKQTLVGMSFRLYTDKARSSSIAESIEADRGGLFTLAVSYQNVPDVDERDGDSQIHYGAALFSHIGYDCRGITGHYWTDRRTHGQLLLCEKVDKEASSFSEARELFDR